MNYGAIKEVDIANGPGVRVSLFVSGCRHHCKGCFQPETWSFSYGQEYTDETRDKILELLSAPYIEGLTLLGGEPFEPENQPRLCELVKLVKEKYPQKNIWCYTGYLYDVDLIPGGKYIHRIQTVCFRGLMCLWMRICTGIKGSDTGIPRQPQSKSHQTG